MNIWLAIVIIVAIVFLTDLYSTKLKHEKKTNATQNEMAKLQGRLEDIEYRLANLESLFLDREKENRFHQALNRNQEER